MSAHQYGISVADAQTSLLMKRPYQQRASRDSCFHRLENLLVLDDLTRVFSIFALMDFLLLINSCHKKHTTQLTTDHTL